MVVLLFVDPNRLKAEESVSSCGYALVEPNRLVVNFFFFFFFFNSKQ